MFGGQLELLELEVNAIMLASLMVQHNVLKFTS